MSLLQDNILSLENWCDTNNMSLNVEKCNIVRYSPKNQIIQYPYMINNVALLSVDSINDLVVTFSSKLDFGSHIQRITNKSLRILGLINHIPLFNTPSIYKLLYFALVRPILEYASPIWSPYQRNDIASLESVQQKFMRRLAYWNGSPMHFTNHDYTDIKTQFSITDLSSRRKIFDMLLLY